MAGPENLIAHRGVAGYSQADLNIPENSLRAWNWAANNGADILDLDVHPTQDGKFVVMHDDTINRTTNKTGWIKNHSLSYITSAFISQAVSRSNSMRTTMRSVRRIRRVLSIVSDCCYML